MVLSTGQKVIVIIFLGSLLALAGVIAAPYMLPMRDFDQTYYPAVRYVLAGQNPYTGDYKVTDQGVPPAFFNPPWFLLILLPFGWLPFDIARAEWMVFLIVVTCVSLGLMRWWGFKWPWSVALAALPWSLIGILYGQPAALVFLGAILAIGQIATRPESYQSAALILLGLILTGIKPHLGVLMGLPLGLWLLWRRDKRLLMIVSGGLIFLGLVWLLSPAWPLATAIETQNRLAPLWKSTLERELLLWQLPLWLAWVARLMVITTMGVWAWRAKTLTPAWWSATLAAVLIITLYTRAYDGVLLLPVIGQLISHYPLRFVIFLIIVIAYTTLPLGELGSVITPLTAWIMFTPWRWLASGAAPQ